MGLFAGDIVDKMSVTEITDKPTFKKRRLEENAPADAHSVNSVAYMPGPEQADMEPLPPVLLLDASCPLGPAVIAPVAVVAGRQVSEL